MIEKLISLSLRNRFLVLLTALALFAWGVYSVKTNKIDAIPDLSENQVIVFTEWMGRSPQIIEDQITYPLVTNLQGLPNVKYVRGSSMFGMSFVYIIFDDDTDVYWARERVLERLNYASRLLPDGITHSDNNGRNQPLSRRPPRTRTALNRAPTQLPRARRD